MSEGPNESEASRPAGADEAPARPRGRGRMLRRVLLVAGPLAVLLVGGYIYLTTGRFIGTENAYVQADMVAISPEIAGPITRIDVRENQKVAAGDVLFVIDEAPYRVAVERAEAQLEAVGSMIESVKAQYEQRVEQLELAHTNLAFADRELKRERSLAERDLSSDADVDRAQHEYDVAVRQIEIVKKQLTQLRVQLGDVIQGGPSNHAAYRSAKAMRDRAALDLAHTVVKAPFAGVVSKVPKVGGYVAPGAPVMSLVSDNDVWIEANYKETELTNVRVGQPVKIGVDIYPDREWEGVVESISPATGAEFSVIPPQNATGNWVKIAQRIPVRIAVEVSPDDPPLRAGLSATVEVDTGHARKVPAFLSLIQNSLVDTSAAATRPGHD